MMCNIAMQVHHQDEFAMELGRLSTCEPAVPAAAVLFGICSFGYQASTTENVHLEP